MAVSKPMSQEQRDEARNRLRAEKPLSTSEVDCVLRWSHDRLDSSKNPPNVLESLFIRLLHFGYVLSDGYTVPSPVSPKRVTEMPPDLSGEAETLDHPCS